MIVTRGFAGNLATSGFGPFGGSDLAVLTKLEELSGAIVTSALERPDKMSLVGVPGADQITVGWSLPSGYATTSRLIMRVDVDADEPLERVEIIQASQTIATFVCNGYSSISRSFVVVATTTTVELVVRTTTAAGAVTEEDRTVTATPSSVPNGMQFEIEYALVTSLTNPVPIPQGRIGWRDYDATRDQTSFVDRSRYRGWVWYYRIRFRMHLSGVAVHTSEWSPWASEGPWT